MHTCISTVYSVGLHLLDLHNVWMPQLFVVDDLPLHVLADLRIAPMLLRATGRSDLKEDSPLGDALCSLSQAGAHGVSTRLMPWLQASERPLGDSLPCPPAQ